MADPWKALDGDDASDSTGPGPRRLEAFTAPSTLTDRDTSRNGDAAQLPGSPVATPGLAGHRALAALAAELAQAAAVDDADAEASDSEKGNTPIDGDSGGARSHPISGATGPTRQRRIRRRRRRDHEWGRRRVPAGRGNPPRQRRGQPLHRPEPRRPPPQPPEPRQRCHPRPPPHPNPPAYPHPPNRAPAQSGRAARLLPRGTAQRGSRWPAPCPGYPCRVVRRR